VADINSLVAKVRVELGDIGKSFVTQFTADGTTNRFRLHYAPLDATTVIVNAGGFDVTDYSHVEESTGVLVVTLTNALFPTLVNSGSDVPNAGVEFLVSGTYFRYFTGTELSSLVTTAIGEHGARHTDSLGRKITVSNLPVIEEYPVAVYATTLALYTLATDAAFDIDIAAPDGVSIPRSERYRQLMDMINARQSQYKDLCVQLGIGMYSIDVFTLRRISKATNRYVPVYKPMEVDDRSFPQRVYLPEPTYGDQRPAFPTEAADLTAYQGRKFLANISYTGNWAGNSFVAKLYQQRGSVQVIEDFALQVNSSKNSWVVTGLSRTSGNAKITVTVNPSPAATHDFVVGDSVVITSANSAVDGTYVVVAPVTSNTFSVMGTATTALALTGLTGDAEHNVSQTYVAAISLTSDETMKLANRTWWKITGINSFTGEELAIVEGDLFTVRASEVVL
jgi:hypothetical protein